MFDKIIFVYHLKRGNDENDDYKAYDFLPSLVKAQVQASKDQQLAQLCRD